MLGLWSVQGLGEVSFARIQEGVPDLGTLLDEPGFDWARPLGLSEKVLTLLEQGPRVAVLAERALEAIARTKMSVAFPGDPAFPARLASTADCPPVLYLVGPGAEGGARRRVAMVGTRAIDPDFLGVARRIAAQVAASGVGVISGAAQGVDTECHLGALGARGETWAFMGAGLDQLDPHQRSLGRAILEGGGTVFADFPPGTRPDKSTFPRRNRLISGSSDAVVFCRGDRKSGAMHTVRYAWDQGRPVLAIPGELGRRGSDGPNLVVREGRARLCLDAGDVLDAVGLADSISGAPEPAPRGGGVAQLTRWAQQAYEALRGDCVDFDELHARMGRPEAGAVMAALVELELKDLVIQKPGRRFERI